MGRKDIVRPASKRTKVLLGLTTAAVLALPTFVLLGPGLLGVAVLAPVAGAAFAAGYRLPELRAKSHQMKALPANEALRPVRIEPPDPDILQDIQRMIDQFDRVQAQVPSPEGKALIWKAIDASQLVVERLRQESTPASQARRVHRKLKSYSLVLTRYESLANGKLLAADDGYREQLIEQIEKDGLSRIANQLEQFARSMDDDEIMELEIELQMLKHLG